jgi:rfaE bifunctional protein nucleotidyltransferase chain/domain
MNMTDCTENKVVTVPELQTRLRPLRQNGRRIVFTNGCFDILHVGHVRYLTAARQAGDVLIVGLNSDHSVRSIKGPRRPVVPDVQRAEVLAALSCVDFVVVFDEPDPFNVIRALLPDVLAKGADWSEARIIGADVVKAAGGTVLRIPVVPDVSTTRLIDKIVAEFSA